MVELESERLVGEPAGEVHRDFAATLFGEPEIARWIWPEGREGVDAVGPRTRQQTDAILDRFVANWRIHGFGWWFLRERSSGELVGEVGLQWATLADDEREVEIGWTVLPAHWGSGYATEAASAALAHAFGPAALDTVVAFTMPHNVASRRVMDKLGMAYERDIARAGLPHVLYRASSPH